MIVYSANVSSSWKCSTQQQIQGKSRDGRIVLQQRWCRHDIVKVNDLALSYVDLEDTR
jgi:hypothetical protein